MKKHRRSGELSSSLFETYKNDVRPHGCHIYNFYVDINTETMCQCTSQHHGLLHWEFVLLCFKKFPGVHLFETYKNSVRPHGCHI